MKDQDYILFDQYLLKELSAEDLTIFENRLKTDLEFQKQFHLYKDLSSHLQHTIENETETNAFKENLEGISKDYFNKVGVSSQTEIVTQAKRKTKTVTFIKYAMVACIAFLIGIFTLNNIGDPTYSDYNNHEPMTVVRADVKDLIDATKAFNNKNYEGAKQLLEKVLKKNPDNSEVQLYYAITNLELDDFTVADIIFNKLSQGDSAYKYRATWYAALSQLKQKQNTACIALLKQIPEDADDYKQAQKLLDKLE